MQKPNFHIQDYPNLDPLNGKEYWVTIKKGIVTIERHLVGPNYTFEQVNEYEPETKKISGIDELEVYRIIGDNWALICNVNEGTVLRVKGFMRRTQRRLKIGVQL